MIDRDLLNAARGAALEAAGVALRDEALAERGRLVQFTHLRRRQVRVTRQSLAERRPWRRSRAVSPPTPPRASPAVSVPQAAVRLPWTLVSAAAKPPAAVASALLGGVLGAPSQQAANGKGAGRVS